MTKHFERRNLHTIYIREIHKQIWNEFLDLIEGDKNIRTLKYKSKDGLISIAIMNLIYNYVQNKKEENFNEKTAEKIENNEEKEDIIEINNINKGEIIDNNIENIEKDETKN